MDEPDDLLQAARGGDEAAFRSVYRLLAPGLSRYAASLVGADAEDVASEAWLQIVRDLAAFRGGWTDFRRWTATVTRHRALDHLRQRQRRPAHPLPLEDMVGVVDPADLAQDVLDRLATYEAIAFIATLPKDQAEAVILRVILDFDAKTIGAIMKKREGTIRVLVHRGLKELEKRLERAPDLPDRRSVTSATRSALEEVR